MAKINKLKRDKLVHNYEQRVKNFIYKISEDPNYLSKNNSLFLSLKNNNNNTKKLSDNNKTFFNKKRFCFSSFETDRMKAQKYDMKQKKLEKLLNENFPLKNVNNKQIHKNQSFSPKMTYNYKLLKNSMDIKNNVDNDRMKQPRLRFKPRNDMERILDEIKDLRLFHGNLNYLNTLKKQIIKMQKLEFNNEMKKTNDLKNLVFIDKKENKNYKKIYNLKNININENYNLDNTDIFNNKHYSRNKNSNNGQLILYDCFINGKTNEINNINKILDVTNTKQYKKNELNNEYFLNSNLDDSENLLNNNTMTKNKKNNKGCLIIEDKNNNNKDFLSEKKQNLHKGYDIKTYFNCMQNYSLWKESCFINPNLLKKKNNKRQIDNYKTKSHFSSMIKSPKSTSSSYFSSLKTIEKHKNFSKTFYKNMNSLLLKKEQKKKNNLTPKQLVLLLNDYKNNDIFGIDEDNGSNNDINDNKNKLLIIKKIAFDKDFKGYNYIQNNNRENYEKFKKRLLNLKMFHEEETDNNNSFKDIGEICNNILRNYGFIKKINNHKNLKKKIKY